MSMFVVADDVVIEVDDEHEELEPTSPQDLGSFFYKLIIALCLFLAYLFVQRLSAWIGARAARRLTGADQRNFDEEMRESRRRLQERFEAERKKREEEKKKKDSTVSESTNENPQTETQNPKKRVKPVDPDLLKRSGEYFPLMGDAAGSSRVCMRRSRNTGG